MVLKIFVLQFFCIVILISSSSSLSNGLDFKLQQAEANPMIIKVSKDASKFKTIQEALNSIPPPNNRRVIISIAAGVYSCCWFWVDEFMGLGTEERRKRRRKVNKREKEGEEEKEEDETN
ncbi:pectinesterase [Medicago truncatula]|uniref:Pectinesterase n=1 Tax=Medicago truncatula TaxID=3880 RepID=A0A072UCA3_MEDTR|nr:pectinesterase [Medicago truncatula]